MREMFCSVFFLLSFLCARKYKFLELFVVESTEDRRD